MKNNTSKLTLQIGDNITSWETDHIDLTVSEILWGMYGCLVGQTFFPESFINALRDFVDEHSSIDSDETDYEISDGKFHVNEDMSNHYPALCMVESVYPHEMNDVERRAVRHYHSTETIPVKEYYPDDTQIDIKKELEALSEQPKTVEVVQRIANLKRLRVKRKWFNKWFLNTAIKDRKQYVTHLNAKFYWPWLPETVFCDTVFVNYYPDKPEPVVRRYDNMLFLIDHACANYEDTTSNITLNKLDSLLADPDTKIDIVRGEKMI